MKPLIIYFSGRFLTKHPVNKNLISLKPKIIGSYMGLFTVQQTADSLVSHFSPFISESACTDKTSTKHRGEWRETRIFFGTLVVHCLTKKVRDSSPS